MNQMKLKKNDLIEFDLAEKFGQLIGIAKLKILSYSFLFQVSYFLDCCTNRIC